MNSPLKRLGCPMEWFTYIMLQRLKHHENGKASLAETFFQKLFGKRRAARIEGSGLDLGLAGRFLGWGSIPGVGARFLGSGPIIRFWRGFAIFQLFSI